MDMRSALKRTREPDGPRRETHSGGCGGGGVVGGGGAGDERARGGRGAGARQKKGLEMSTDDVSSVHTGSNQALKA